MAPSVEAHPYEPHTERDWPFNQRQAELWFPPGRQFSFRYPNARRFRHRIYSDWLDVHSPARIGANVVYVNLFDKYTILSTRHMLYQDAAWISVQFRVEGSDVLLVTNASRDKAEWLWVEPLDIPVVNPVHILH